MAFLKYAYAAVVKPIVSLPAWDEVRHRAMQGGSAFDQRIAAQVVLNEFDPNQFLLSHATIIASVDVENGPGQLGRHFEGGFTVNRKFQDYYITPNTSKFINNNCFAPGTMILMGDGSEKPIEQISVGDKVVSHTGNIRCVVETMVRPFKGKACEIKRLGDNRTLIVTSEHPFWAMTPANVCACGCGSRINYRHYKAAAHRFKDFKRGHQTRRLPSPSYNWISAGMLAKGDFLAYPKLKGTSNPEGITPGKAKLLGYFLAEGYYYKQKPARVSASVREAMPGADNYPVAVCFGLNSDERETLAAEIRKLLLEEFRVESGVYSSGADSNGIYVQSRNSLEAVTFFQELCGEGSKTKRLAPDVLTWPVELQRLLIQAWMEGDGCVEATAGGWLSATSASETLISQLQVILSRLGVFATRSRSQTHGRKRVRRANGTVEVVNDYTKQSVAYKLQIGSVQAESVLGGSFLEPVYRAAISRRRKHTLSFRNGSDEMMFPIRSTQKVDYDGLVYNFETEVDHSYVANGVAVHNCDSWERKLLLATFKTFIGGDNFIEHLQIPELSKGKIIDAAARDIGDSIYVDILVATDRKHTPLIDAISSGQLSTLSMGCFLPGTQVSIGDGTRVAIEDVQVGDYVLTHKGRLREVTNKQLRLGSWGIQKIQAVGVPSTILVTDNHPFFVLRPATTCACGCGAELHARRNKDPVRRVGTRFKIGHDKRILNPNGSYSLEEYRERSAKMAELKALRIEEVRADQLQPGDYLCFPKVQSLGVSEGATEGKAKLLGYFLAEGSFLKRKGEPVEVQFNFALNELTTFVAEVLQLLKGEFPDANEPWIQERPDRNTATVHMTGRDAVKWFKTHGGEYSHRKKLSFEVMNWPSELHLPLLGAWLNGDGTDSVGSGHALSGTSTSYDLICQMHWLALSNGVFARLECLYGGHSVDIQEVVNAGFVPHSVTGKRPYFNLVFGKHFASKLTNHTERSLGESTRPQNLREFDDVMIFPITSVVPARYEGWVHDMEVEEDHSYVVEGVAVHNCQVSHTTCSKCGNVSEDETQLCSHIRYSKGNTFVDGLGKTRKIAELCGHISDPKSVKFIEASWVANPAFTGAVLRNILSPQEIAGLAPKMQLAFSQPTRVADPTMLQKAARKTISAQEQNPTEGEGQAPIPEDPMETAVDELADHIRQKAIEKVKSEMTSPGTKSPPGPPGSEDMNNTLLRQALSQNPGLQKIAQVVTKSVKDPLIARRIVTGLVHHHHGGWTQVAKQGFSGKEILAISRILDLSSGLRMAGDNRVYRTVVAVGGAAAYADVESYLTACHRVIRRDMTMAEKEALIVKGRLYDLGQ